MKLIGITGKKGSGKDTIAKVLSYEYGFVRLAFGDSLKLETKKIFPRTLRAIAKLHGLTVGPSGDALDAMLKAKLPGVRELLQEFGTGLRRAEYEDYWVQDWSAVYHAYFDKGTAVVAPDVRFANEAEEIIDWGGEIWKVERPGADDGDDHPSELGIPDHLVSEILINDGSASDLEEKTRILYEWLPK